MPSSVSLFWYRSLPPQISSPPGPWRFFPFFLPMPIPNWMDALFFLAKKIFFLKRLSSFFFPIFRRFFSGKELSFFPSRLGGARHSPPLSYPNFFPIRSPFSLFPTQVGTCSSRWRWQTLARAQGFPLGFSPQISPFRVFFARAFLRNPFPFSKKHLPFLLPRSRLPSWT